MQADILNRFAAVDEAAVDRVLAEEIAKSPDKLIALDDDPTGVQTVHGISVYTDWSQESVRAGFAEPGKLFYILTNSRGMTRERTRAVHEEIAAVVGRVSRESGRPFVLLSRSDSTLRGHYPLETETLRRCLAAQGMQVDGEILCPFFKEGGRYTIDNVHYVRDGDQLIPAAQTEFARDKTFGYHHSAIPDYVEEKTGGAYPAAGVVCVPLEMLRRCDYDGVAALLAGVQNFGKVCVNAVDYCDLKVFAVALYRAMAAGKRFLLRTAAGLVKVLGGVPDRPLLRREEMVRSAAGNGGMVVVGSHTEKTTEQLRRLLTLPGVEPVAFDSDLVLSPAPVFEAEIRRCVARAEEILRAGKTAVCYTNRKLLSLAQDTPEQALRRSVQISDGVQRLVGELTVTPAFVVAKGGITSSDIGTRALRVRRALVLGQILPGIPVWQTGPESRFSGVPYVIFPGNTGGPDALRQAVEILQQG